MSGPMPDEIRNNLKSKAIDLRTQGWTYREIAGSLNISISTCSLWLRDVPAPPRPGYRQERVAAMWKARWEPYHIATERERHEVKLAACAEMGELDERETLLAGALVYWCEGSKDKIYRRSEKVSFINSDPALIAFFLRFLETAGVSRDRIQFRLHIHETADIAEATKWWSEWTGTPVEDFRKPTVKRHNPKTNRKNLVDEYRGCVQITVRKGADLYRRIEGWAYGALLGGEAARTRLISRSDEAVSRIIAEHGMPR
ncbi:hypothetical protein [Actinomadura rubrisoli]|uniref:Uncharacterized protein n=1 Tax=Actinomadura rubrisoli TaxID=2530368 RepID=A0A4R5AW50_9ACTN|nr:hypothetical protein [Actinomadura rubrisoli]TDD77668.1 hypothetical protein E1298_29830 [Actinomadura rubrisoli]